MPTNHHDLVFKKLMSHSDFLYSFMRAYLPTKLQSLINWDPGLNNFIKTNNQYLEEKTGRKFESDLIYRVKLKDKNKFLLIHCEHQSSYDKSMMLRILNYQIAELLTHQSNQNKKNKQNKNQIPSEIISLIYHQGKKHWPAKTNLINQNNHGSFFSPLGNFNYFGNPILIDLLSSSDDELRSHGYIGPIEIFLKHIRLKDFEQKIYSILSELKSIDDKCRKTLLEYLIRVSDIPQDKLIQIIEETLPNDKENTMTVYEQLIQKGLQQGMQQGIQTEKLKIAQVLLLEGADISFIQKITELSNQKINQLKAQLLN